MIVHASLSRLGWVVGGAQAVVEALLDTAGPAGTIVMPAQTGMSDPSTWEDPPVPESWWQTIRDHWPAFDPWLTPLRAMGAVADCLRRCPGVRHSGHPTNGFIGLGPRADWILGEHPLEHSLGGRSPLGRLYQDDARVVLIGVDHANNTSLHLAEEHADFPGKRLIPVGAPMRVDDQRRWVAYRDLSYDSDDFAELGNAFVVAGGVEGRATVGSGEIITCSMRSIVDFGAEWLALHRRSDPGTTPPP